MPVDEVGLLVLREDVAELYLLAAVGAKVAVQEAVGTKKRCNIVQFFIYKTWNRFTSTVSID